jgi:hypothetical protein
MMPDMSDAPKKHGYARVSPAFAKNTKRRLTGVCTGCGMMPCVCRNPRSVRREKELTRVEAAIRGRDKEELRWAIEYCRRTRRSAARDKREFWRNLCDRAELLLLKLGSSS